MVTNNPLVIEVLNHAHACIEAAERNADGSNTYCIPAEILDALSAALVRLGGAA